MAFLKALQHTITALPEYQEYVTMQLIYQQSCKDIAAFKKHYSHFQLSTNPLERVKFFDEKEKHSSICKQYYAMKKRWQNAAARAKLKERGIDIEDFQIAKTVGVTVPTSITDITKTIREEKKQQIIAAEMPSQLRQDVEEGLRLWKERKEQAERINSAGNGVDDTDKFGETI